MAVKKSLLNGPYTLGDLYDTQDALDSGAIDKVQTGTETWRKQNSFLGIKGVAAGGTKSILGDKNSFGDQLAASDAQAVGAYKRKKQEQTALRAQGVGQSQSVLGGTIV